MFYIFILHPVFAENVFIEAKNIILDKDKVTSIFENEVVGKTKEKTITSDYVKYNKNNGTLIIKENVLAKDN